VNEGALQITIYRGKKINQFSLIIHFISSENKKKNFFNTIPNINLMHSHIKEINNDNLKKKNRRCTKATSSSH
jgi:hypothetical protein